MAGKRSDVVRLQHRVFDFSCSRSLGQLHGEFDDNNHIRSGVFKQLSGGRDRHTTAGLFDQWSGCGVLQHDKHVHGTGRSGTKLRVVGEWRRDAQWVIGRLIGSGECRSDRILHSSSDNDSRSELYQHVRAGSDNHATAGVFNQRAGCGVLQHDKHVHRTGRGRTKLCVVSKRERDN